MKTQTIYRYPPKTLIANCQFPTPKKNTLGYISEEFVFEVAEAAEKCNADKAGLRKWRQEQKKKQKE